jgi:uncharacterized OsmC-like protein
MDEETFTVTLDLEDGFRFLADFQQPGVEPLAMDEPAPLGAGSGPNAARVLGATVGDCLSASALFCLRRARIDVKSMRTEVSGTLTRNEAGRLRIGGISVRIEPEVLEEDIPRMKRCLEIFEDYCIVAESVRKGIPIEVAVDTRAATPA